jgi:hypothetical protein
MHTKEAFTVRYSTLVCTSQTTNGLIQTTKK